MIKDVVRLALLCLAALALVQGCKDMGTAPPPSTPAPPASTDSVRFSTVIQPILLTNCANPAGCHGGSSPQNGFNQESYAGVRAGGTKFGTNVVISGDSTNSEMRKALRGIALVSQMPLGGPTPAPNFPDSQIVKIARWIQQGAKNN